MNKAYFAIVLLASACYSVAGEEKTTALPENPCASKFKADPKRITISEACVSESGLGASDTNHTEEEFIKTFDDKCYGKCLLTKLDILKDLKFDRDAIKADILAHVLDESFQKSITNYTMNCLDTAEKSVKEITKDNICKLSAQILYCCRSEELKLVC